MSMTEAESEIMAMLAVNASSVAFLEGLRFGVEIFGTLAENGQTVTGTMAIVSDQANDGAYEELARETARRVVSEMADEMGREASDE